MNAALAGDAETASAALLSSHFSPPEAQSLLSLIARPWAVVVGLWADRPSLPPSAASPPPTAAGRHASARSECCARRQNTLVHDADIPRPCSSQRRPRSTLQTQTPAGECPMERAAGKWPRAGTPGGARLRGYVPTGFDPPRAFPTGICEIGSCPPTEFRNLSRLPDSGRPAQRT